MPCGQVCFLAVSPPCSRIVRWQKNKALKKTRVRENTNNFNDNSKNINDLFIIWNQPRWSIFLVETNKFFGSLSAISFDGTLAEKKEMRTNRGEEYVFVSFSVFAEVWKRFIDLKFKNFENVSFSLVSSCLAVFEFSCCSCEILLKSKSHFLRLPLHLCWLRAAQLWANLIKPSSQKFVHGY